MTKYATMMTMESTTVAAAVGVSSMIKMCSKSESVGDGSSIALLHPYEEPADVNEHDRKAEVRGT